VEDIVSMASLFCVCDDIPFVVYSLECVMMMKYDRYFCTCTFVLSMKSYTSGAGSCVFVCWVGFGFDFILLTLLHIHI